MKVLMINSVCGIKSTGRICTDLADFLVEKGHICKIAYGRDSVPEKYKSISYRISTESEVIIDGVQTRLFDNAGLNSKKATRRFLDWVKDYDPDIIHLHNLHGYYINIQMLFDYLKESRKKVIWTLHDCWAFTGHCSHFSEVGCMKWKKGCEKCNQIKAYPQSLCLDRSKRNYSLKKTMYKGVSNLTIVTPSNWLAEMCKQSMLSECDINVIPNGINLDVFQPQNSDFRKRYCLDDKKIILGVASAWGESKGLGLYCELSKVLSKDYKVVLVGLSKEQIKHLPDNIVALEKTNSVKELAEIYSGADVFLNLSKQETMGLTTVEAMACGTPVVVSNLTAVPEVVDEQSGGVLSGLEMNTIIEAIEKVLSKEWPHVRNRAKQYELHNQYKKYLELYEQILQKE